MAEPGSVTLKEEEEEEIDQDHVEMRRLSLEELKQMEKSAIKKELEETEAQLEKLDEVERAVGDNEDEDMDELLQSAGIHVKNIMEFNATLELSAPRDVSKMYNFSGVHSNLPRDDINLQFCRGQLKNKKEMLQAMMGESNRRKSLLDHQTLLTLKNAEESHLMRREWNSNKILSGIKDPKVEDMSRFWSSVSDSTQPCQDKTKLRSGQSPHADRNRHSLNTAMHNYLNKVHNDHASLSKADALKIAPGHHKTMSAVGEYLNGLEDKEKEEEMRRGEEGGERLEVTKNFWEGVSDDVGDSKIRIFESKIDREADVKKSMAFWKKQVEEKEKHGVGKKREVPRVQDKTDFWRKASLQQIKEKRPQIEANPDWLMEYKKEGFNNDQPEKVGFWNKIITTTAEEKKPKKMVHVTNEEKIRKKQEKWELSVTDDSWYRAPQFHPEVDHTRRTDIEILCEIIYAHGERYDDGTAAIGFTWLFKVFNRANTVGILIKAKKHGLVFFDGEIVFASVRSEDDDEFVVLQKPIAEIRAAFKEMRERHPDMFDIERKGKRRQTVVLPGYDEETEDDSDEFLEEDEEDESL